MSLYSQLLEGLIFPVGDLLNGSNFIANLRRWRQIQTMDGASLTTLSDSNLRNILSYAATNIPYYKRLDLHLDSEDLMGSLQSFPIVKKKDIKAELDSFVSPNSRNLLAYESSGSSGIQGKVFMTKEEQSMIRAILILWWEWAGYSFGKPFIQTGMTPKRGLIKSVKDWLLRTRYIVAFDLDDKIIDEILTSMDGKGYAHMGGYASSLYLFGKVAAKRGGDLQLNSVISWGDKMFPHYRSTIENAFQTKVFDTYACNEGLMIAAQHDLPYYYIMSPHVYVEIVDDFGKPVADGEMGHVVVTRLDNYSMPLIRYYNGDLAVKLPSELYPKERAFRFPLLERIIGRDTDIVKTRSGKYLIVHFFTGIFEFYPAIRQFRVIQKDLDSVIIEYIPEEGFDSSVLARITEEIVTHIGEHFLVTYNQVDHIPVTPSGKPQIVKSELANVT